MPTSAQLNLESQQTREQLDKLLAEKKAAGGTYEGSWSHAKEQEIHMLERRLEQLDRMGYKAVVKESGGQTEIEKPGYKTIPSNQRPQALLKKVPMSWNERQRQSYYERLSPQQRAMAESRGYELPKPYEQKEASGFQRVRGLPTQHPGERYVQVTGIETEGGVVLRKPETIYIGAGGYQPKPRPTSPIDIARETYGTGTAPVYGQADLKAGLSVKERFTLEQRTPKETTKNLYGKVTQRIRETPIGSTTYGDFFKYTKQQYQWAGRELEYGSKKLSQEDWKKADPIRKVLVGSGKALSATSYGLAGTQKLLGEKPLAVPLLLGAGYGVSAAGTAIAGTGVVGSTAVGTFGVIGTGWYGTTTFLDIAGRPTIREKAERVGEEALSLLALGAGARAGAKLVPRIKTTIKSRVGIRTIKEGDVTFKEVVVKTKSGFPKVYEIQKGTKGLRFGIAPESTLKGTGGTFRGVPSVRSAFSLAKVVSTPPKTVLPQTTLALTLDKGFRTLQKKEQLGRAREQLIEEFQRGKLAPSYLTPSKLRRSYRKIVIEKGLDTTPKGVFSSELKPYVPESYTKIVKKEQLGRAREQLIEEFQRGKLAPGLRTPSKLRRTYRRTIIRKGIDLTPKGIFGEPKEPIKLIVKKRPSSSKARKDVRKVIRYRLGEEALSPRGAFASELPLYQPKSYYKIKQKEAGIRAREQLIDEILGRKIKLTTQVRPSIRRAVRRRYRDITGAYYMKKGLPKPKNLLIDIDRFTKLPVWQIKKTDTLLRDLYPKKEKPKKIIRKPEEKITPGGQVLIMKPPKIIKKPKFKQPKQFVSFDENEFKFLFPRQQPSEYSVLDRYTRGKGKIDFSSFDFGKLGNIFEGVGKASKKVGKQNRFFRLGTLLNPRAVSKPIVNEQGVPTMQWQRDISITLLGQGISAAQRNNVIQSNTQKQRQLSKQIQKQSIGLKVGQRVDLGEVYRPQIKTITKLQLRPRSQRIQRPFIEEVPKFPPEEFLLGGFTPKPKGKKKKKPRIPFPQFRTTYTPTLVGLEFLPRVKARRSMGRRAYSGFAPRPQVRR